MQRFSWEATGVELLNNERPKCTVPARESILVGRSTPGRACAPFLEQFLRRQELVRLHEVARISRQPAVALLKGMELVAGERPRDAKRVGPRRTGRGSPMAAKLVPLGSRLRAVWKPALREDSHLPPLALQAYRPRGCELVAIPAPRVPHCYGALGPHHAVAIRYYLGVLHDLPLLRGKQDS